MEALRRYRVWMHSRPAAGRTFYDGKVDVFADHPDEAEERAIERAARVHGHREWTVERIEIVTAASGEER